MQSNLTSHVLQSENHVFLHTGGVSENNRSHGFRPAFLDMDTGAIYLSCFADGRPAPFHLLDGLPDTVVIVRDPGQRVVTVKASVVSGFVKGCRFYTREEAKALVADAA